MTVDEHISESKLRQRHGGVGDAAGIRSVGDAAGIRGVGDAAGIRGVEDAAPYADRLNGCSL